LRLLIKTTLVSFEALIHEFARLLVSIIVASFGDLNGLLNDEQKYMDKSLNV
jgi:hypothetical protein